MTVLALGAAAVLVAFALALAVVDRALAFGPAPLALARVVLREALRVRFLAVLLAGLLLLVPLLPNLLSPQQPLVDRARLVIQYGLGAAWILAADWLPYQRPTFVTPAFPGFTSGHSTFSRAAAEVLTRFTGSRHFPGGLGEFLAPAHEFLEFESGPSEPIVLQWAAYQDAADEAGLSRLWGGIHVAADDFNGRITGHDVGIAAFDLASTYWGTDATAQRVP